MPEFTLPVAGDERQEVRRHGRPHARGSNSIRAYHLYVSVLPTAAMAFLGLVAVIVLLLADQSTVAARIVLVAAAVGAVAVLAAAIFGADSATRREQRLIGQPARGQDYVQRRLADLGMLIGRGRKDLQELAARVRDSEPVAPRRMEFPPADGRDPFMHLAYEVQKAQNEAWNAVLEAAGGGAAEGADQRVEVFVNLARRMQTLSHRAIQGLDELENQVEDPDLLKGLFKVDHLSTRMRRQAESLAVIGGAASRRQWSRPVTVYEVLRSAIAEVEHYNRVKVVPSVEGTLDGSAVADVIHLLAELIENATKFAPPHTQVLLRAEAVTAGLAIEVEDRGLGIPRDSQRQLNDLLADLGRIDIDEMLQDGRIGLLVVSSLARRHNVEVRLQTNLYGGTQAIVVVPQELIGSEAQEDEQRLSAPEPVPALTGAPTGPIASPAQAVPAGLAAPTAPTAAALVSANGARATVRADDEHAAARTAEQPAVGTGDHPVAGVPKAGAPEALRPAKPSVDAQAGERPSLPRRHAQANLAPELLNAPDLGYDDPCSDQNPGLMAAFQRGMRSGQESDVPAAGADGTS